jgi:DNA-binding NarL/FixJ family response regulator
MTPKSVLPFSSLRFGNTNMFKTLIVEDNIRFRQSLTELLRNRFPFMTIDEAGDGGEALRKIDALVPDLIFMDIKLPGENGLEVTKKIKKRYPEIVIVILTYYDSPEHREAAGQCGARSFLPKTTSTEEVVEMVQSILSEKGPDFQASGGG